MSSKVTRGTVAITCASRGTALLVATVPPLGGQGIPPSPTGKPPIPAAPAKGLSERTRLVPRDCLRVLARLRGTGPAHRRGGFPPRTGGPAGSRFAARAPSERSISAIWPAPHRFPLVFLNRTLIYRLAHVSDDGRLDMEGCQTVRQNIVHTLPRVRNARFGQSPAVRVPEQVRRRCSY